MSNIVKLSTILMLSARATILPYYLFSLVAKITIAWPHKLIVLPKWYGKYNVTHGNNKLRVSVARIDVSVINLF